MKKTLITLFFCCALSLQAEVEQITIKWNAFLCNEICLPSIESNLKSIRHVKDLQIDSRSGTAVMGWDPNYPFTYDPFRLAMSAAGIRINDIRIKVRGTITHDADKFYLISNGDLAKYWIVGPIKIQGDRYIPRNLASHEFSGDTKAQLVEAEAKGFEVTAAGPLYEPTQYPRTMVVEQMKIHSTEDQMNPAYKL